MEKLVTVCTPTYNREKMLERPFKSLMNQTCKDFVWLVIDDGSADDTEKLIDEYKKTADFEVEYHKKENGGRHTALNMSYQFIRTEYVINLDSDDELTPTAIESIIKIHDDMPKDDYDRFWQISGRCIDSESRQMVGKPFCEGINDLKGVKQRKKLGKFGGEKSNCRKVDILRKNPFPTFTDTKFVTENTVWEKINKDFDSYCVNNVFRVYYQDSSDSLAKGKVHNDTRMRSRYHFSVFCLNELFDQITYNKSVRIAIFNIARAAMCSGMGYKQVMGEIDKKYKRFVVTTIGYPVAWLYVLLFEKNKH